MEAQDNEKKAAPLTSHEAAERLNINRSTLTRWVLAGDVTPLRQLPGARGAYLFDPQAISDLAKQKHNESK